MKRSSIMSVDGREMNPGDLLVNQRPMRASKYQEVCIYWLTKMFHPWTWSSLKREDQWYSNAMKDLPLKKWYSKQVTSSSMVVWWKLEQKMILTALSLQSRCMVPSTIHKCPPMATKESLSVLVLFRCMESQFSILGLLWRKLLLLEQLPSLYLALSRVKSKIGK